MWLVVEWNTAGKPVREQVCIERQSDLSYLLMSNERLNEEVLQDTLSFSHLKNKQQGIG